MTSPAQTERNVLSALSRDALLALAVRDSPGGETGGRRPGWRALAPFYVISEMLGRSRDRAAILQEALDAALLIPGVESAGFVEAPLARITRHSAAAVPSAHRRLQRATVPLDRDRSGLLLVQFSDVAARDAAGLLVGHLAALLGASLRRARTLADLQGRVDDAQRSTLETILRLRESATALAGWLEILQTMDLTAESLAARRAIERIDRETQALVRELREFGLPPEGPKVS